jgi:hypothetical protein
MLEEVVAPSALRKAIKLRQSKLESGLVASAGIWAEHHPNGSGFYGVQGAGRRAVEINIPLHKKTRGLVATEKGRTFLCHSGRLSDQLQISQSDVRRAMAKDLCRVSSKNRPVEYIVVACLDDRPALVVKKLAHYVRVGQQLMESNVEALSDERLEQLARSMGKEHPKKSTLLTNQYERSEHVSRWAKRRAKGLCDLCDEPAPFSTSSGPYLECHHIVHLSERGPDLRKHRSPLPELPSANASHQ